MKNQLLNLKMIALMCLLMVLGGANVWAEQYKIVFAKGGSTATGSKIDETTSLKDVLSEGLDCVSEIKSFSNAFCKSKGGIKIGGSSTGSIELGIVDACQANIKKITVKSSAYSSTDNAKVSLFNGTISLTSGTPGTDLVYTFVNPTTVSSIKLSTSKVDKKSKPRAFISEIILETEANNPTLVASESALDFGAVENNTSKNLTFKLSGSKLTADATLSVSGDYFTVTPTSVAQTDGTIPETDVTVSYNPTAVGSYTATLTISSTGAEAKTITLTGTSANAYTVAWNVNGNAYTDGTPTTKVFDGEKVTVLPTTPTDINGKVFVGWTNASLSAPQDAAPKVLFTDVADAPKVTGDVTYYAVFANKAGSEVTYTKLTSDQFKTDATYVIGAEQSATNNTMWYFNGNVDKNWGRMSSTTSIESLMTFTLSGSASALVVKGENGKYLNPAPSKGNFPEMSSEETKVILGIDGTIKTLDETLSLRHNYNTSTGGGLRWYSGDTGESAYFYEVSGGYTYSGYCTTAAKPTYTPATVNFVAYAGADYYATFSNANVVFMPENVTVQTVAVASNEITFTTNVEGVFGDPATVNIEGSKITGYYIPANTGVLLESKEKTVTYYTVENIGDTGYLKGFNMLMPSVAGGVFEATTGYKYYKLAYNNYDARTGLGFYWGAENGDAFKVKAGTAYLAVPDGEATAKGFTLNGEATGIEGVNANVENVKAIYNLNGQRVASMAKPGLYIVNGKKVVRK